MFPATRLLLPLHNCTLMNQAVPYIYRHILYHICTCFNCLPEDEPSGSKHVSVGDSVKN